MQEQDPILYVLHKIYENKGYRKRNQAIDDKVKDLVAECEQFAEDSPFPEKMWCMMWFTNKGLSIFYPINYKLWQKWLPCPVWAIPWKKAPWLLAENKLGIRFEGDILAEIENR